MGWCLGLSLSLLVASQAAPGWWSESSLLERGRAWLRLAGQEPAAAAVRLAELGDQPQADLILRWLVQQDEFTSALAAVLKSGREAPRVDSCLARGGREVLAVLAPLLQARRSLPVAARRRCAAVLGRLGSPEAWPCLLDALERESDPSVLEAAVLALYSCNPPARGDGRRVAALLQRPEFSRPARRLIRLTLGNLATLEAIQFLGGDADGADPPERVDALLALQLAGIALRGREPQGPAAALLVGAAGRPGGFAEHFWRTGGDTGLRGASAAFLWSNLLPPRFEHEMEQRGPRPAFWLAAARDPNALRTWCRATAERWPWPAFERLQAVRALLTAGLEPTAADGPRIALAEELTRGFPEWPIVAAAAALASRDPAQRAAGQAILCAVGDAGASGAWRALKDLTWAAMPDQTARDALEQAGQVPPALAWAAEQAIAHQRTEELVSYVTRAGAAALRDRILAELLAVGDTAALRRLAREGRLTAPQRSEVLARLAARGGAADVLLWAREDPEAYLRRLARLSRSDRPEQAEPAALLLVCLLKDADLPAAATAWSRLLTVPSLPQPVAGQAWQRCREHVRRHRTPWAWALSLLGQEPARRRWLAAQDLGPLAGEILPPGPGAARGGPRSGTWTDSEHPK